MRRPLRQLLLLLILPATLALTACAPPAPLTPLKEDAVILALGDSLTAGVGGRGFTYPKELEKITGRTVINAGISGETSEGAKQRIAGLLERHKPQLLIVCTGGNDFLRRHDTDQTKRNIATIIETAQAAGVEVVLIAVPRILPFAINHSLYASVAREYNLWLEDEIMKTVLHDPDLKSDQIHANGGGYRKIAEAVAAMLQRAGALPATTAT